jgi:metallo-beta-lactamase class B
MKIFSLFFCITLLINSAFAQQDATKLKITFLRNDFYVYTTYNTYEGEKLPANGMYFVTKNDVVLFDTPWDTTQFQPLLDSIKQRHNKNVTICLATHWHSDRTEGLAYYKKLGIKTYTTKLTDSLCKANNKKRAEYILQNDTTFNIENYSFETYYPGEGHTKDNIVVWFKNEKILYGGCLIKAADAENLGYLGDANTKTYAQTLKNVKAKCKNPKFIIISHSDWKNKKSLNHSIKLAKKFQ